jgi:hypothetical protein
MSIKFCRFAIENSGISIIPVPTKSTKSGADQSKFNQLARAALSEMSNMGSQIQTGSFTAKSDRC